MIIARLPVKVENQLIFISGFGETKKRAKNMIKLKLLSYDFKKKGKVKYKKVK